MAEGSSGGGKKPRSKHTVQDRMKKIDKSIEFHRATIARLEEKKARKVAEVKAAAERMLREAGLSNPPVTTQE